MRYLVLAGVAVHALGVIAIGAAASMSCQRPAAAAGILDVARALAVAPRLSGDLVEKTLGVTLAIDTVSSNPAVTFYKGTPRQGSRFERVVALVDLRVPTPENTVMKGAFLNVELRADAGIDARHVEAGLGRPAELDVPEPNPRYAATYVYVLPPSRLRFSLGPSPASAVVAFSIDRSGESR